MLHVVPSVTVNSYYADVCVYLLVLCYVGYRSLWLRIQIIFSYNATIRCEFRITVVDKD